MLYYTCMIFSTLIFSLLNTPPLPRFSFFQQFCLFVKVSFKEKKPKKKNPTNISCIRRGTLLKLLSGSSSSEEEEHFLLI